MNEALHNFLNHLKVARILTEENGGVIESPIPAMYEQAARTIPGELTEEKELESDIGNKNNMGDFMTIGDGNDTGFLSGHIFEGSSIPDPVVESQEELWMNVAVECHAINSIGITKVINKLKDNFTIHRKEK